MTKPTPILLIAAIAIIALALTAAPNPLSAQVPTQPFIYSGTATINGEPVPDGYSIHAAVEDWTSAAAPVSGGKYEGLAVAPEGANYNNKTVHF